MLRELLVGTFHLVSLEARRTDGTVEHPFGTNPRGTFVFDRSGNFSVQLMDPGRTSEDVARSIGFTGMFGSYVVDEDRQAFIATPDGASHPSLIGAEILRFVNTVDGLAVFNTPPQTIDGIESTTYITWRKVAAP